ncbi:Capsid scaffolding protein [Bienertia sinuspersici]
MPFAKNASSWWIKASASRTNYNKKFWYIGCNACWRAIYADHSQTFTCRSCSGQERVEGNIDFASMGNLSTTRPFYFQVKHSINKGNQYIVLKVLEKLQEENQEDASKNGSLKNENEVEVSTSISI